MCQTQSAVRLRKPATQSAPAPSALRKASPPVNAARTPPSASIQVSAKHPSAACLRTVKRAACGAEVMPVGRFCHLCGIFARLKATRCARPVLIGLQFNTPMSFIRWPPSCTLVHAGCAVPESGCTVCAFPFASRPLQTDRETARCHGFHACMLNLRRFARRRPAPAPVPPMRHNPSGARLGA